MLLSLPYGGLRRSIDGGSTWSPVTVLEPEQAKASVKLKRPKRLRNTRARPSSGEEVVIAGTLADPGATHENTPHAFVLRWMG